MTTPMGELLVVDDDELNRDMLSQRLELNGYAVTAVDGGRQALDLIGRRDFDLILLDVMMPEINGLNVLRLIRQTHPPTDLPVIMVTAKDQSEDVVEAFKAGANDYVTKPIDFSVVLARVATQVTCRRSRAALHRSEARYALAAKGTNDGLWDWDLLADEIYYSTRWSAMLGHETETVSPSPDEWFRRVHPDDLWRVQAALADHLQGLTRHFECEQRLLHEDRTYRWMLSRGVAVRASDGRCVRMAGSLTDITEAKVADALTGLPNRLLFLERLERALERSKRHPEHRFAVLFLDLDRFKLINDSLGHCIGDMLLIAVSRRLEASIRSSDLVSRSGREHTIARLGGDEFTILIDGIKEPANAIRVAERIERELASPFNLGGHEVYTSTSIGITLGGDEYDSPEDLVRDADTAMYSAKSRGKARYEVFDAVMRAQAVTRLQLENELRRALARGEFLLHYQPIVALKDDRLIGFEALVRWRHPDRGLVSPGAFIGVAEETGLIVPIGWWVLEEACRRMADWRDQFETTPPLVISVNLSSKQFLQAGLVEQVERRLRQAGLEPRSLKLEITESAIMSDPEAAAETLNRLRALGVRISIDDFGTGYSSLSYLQRFPIDTLKIDRSFVQNLDNDPKDTEIVRAIVTLAQTLQMDVVAEGVETLIQRDHLQNLGCENGQGYYFSQSIDADIAEEMVAHSLRSVDGWIDSWNGRAPSLPADLQLESVGSSSMTLPRPLPRLMVPPNADNHHKKRLERSSRFT